MTNEAAFPLSHAATPHGSAQPPCEGSAKAVSIGDTTSSFVSGFRPSVGLATIVSNRHKHKQKTFMLSIGFNMYFGVPTAKRKLPCTKHKQ